MDEGAVPDLNRIKRARAFRRAETDAQVERWPRGGMTFPDVAPFRGDGTLDRGAAAFWGQCAGVNGLARSGQVGGRQSGGRCGPRCADDPVWAGDIPRLSGGLMRPGSGHATGSANFLQCRQRLRRSGPAGTGVGKRRRRNHRLHSSPTCQEHPMSTSCPPACLPPRSSRSSACRQRSRRAGHLREAWQPLEGFDRRQPRFRRLPCRAALRHRARYHRISPLRSATRPSSTSTADPATSPKAPRRSRRLHRRRPRARPHGRRSGKRVTPVSPRSAACATDPAAAAPVHGCCARAELRPVQRRNAGMPSAPPRPSAGRRIAAPPLGLMRLFALSGAAAIGLFSVAMALMLGAFIDARMLANDAEVSRDFVQSIASDAASGAVTRRPECPRARRVSRVRRPRGRNSGRAAHQRLFRRPHGAVVQPRRN